MSTEINKTQKETKAQREAEEYENDLENYDDFDTDEKYDLKSEGSRDVKSSDSKDSGATNVLNSSLWLNQIQTENSKSLALSSDVNNQQLNQNLNNLLQKLIQQGKSNAEIKQAVQDQLGVKIGDAEIEFGKNGWSNAYDNGYHGKFLSSKTLGTGTSKTYTSAAPYLDQYLQTQQQVNDAKDATRKAKTDEKQQKMRMNAILLRIMMGDIAGAMQSYGILMDRELRQMGRDVVKKLELIRSARAKVTRTFSFKTPPRSYTGGNAKSAGIAQDKAQRYTQYVQLSTQLMNELQSTEKELVDVLNTMQQDMNNFWQSYAGIRDDQFRTNQRVMTVK